MKILGIIAEYNPFHNGHEYQIKKAKENFLSLYNALHGTQLDRSTELRPLPFGTMNI